MWIPILFRETIYKEEKCPQKNGIVLSTMF